MSAGRPASPSGVRVGAHVSIGRGFAAMARAAAEIGCESVQVFTRSPRGGAAKKLDPADLAKMKSVFEGAGIGPLVVHTPYFVAPASHKEEVGELATRMIVEDARRARELGAPFVVVHAGHHREGGAGDKGRKRAGRNGGPDEGLDGRGPEMVACRVGDALRELAAAGSQGAAGGRGQGGEWPLVLVENGAGAGGDAAGSLENWALCLHLMRQQGLRVGACLDTAHLWGAGWDLESGAAGVEALVRKLEELDLLGLIRVLHLNDSSAARGSGRDKHEHIGEGLIPLDAFRRILREPAFAGMPGIAESSPDDGKLARDMVLLKRLRDGEAE